MHGVGLNGLNPRSPKVSLAELHCTGLAAGAPSIVLSLALTEGVRLKARVARGCISNSPASSLFYATCWA